MVNCWNNYEQVKAWRWEGLKRSLRGFLVTEPQNILWNSGHQPMWFSTLKTDLLHHEHKLNNICIILLLSGEQRLTLSSISWERETNHLREWKWKNLREKTLHARYNKTTVTIYRRRNNETKIKCLSFTNPNSLCFISHHGERWRTLPLW